jgi:hypothetical protein
VNRLGGGLALALVAGCRPAASPSVVTHPRVDAVGRPDAPREAFLDAEADPAHEHPLRARIIRGAAVYPERLGKPGGDPSGRSMSLEVVVLEPDAQGDPVRPRVLCESASHRIAVHVDADDLAIVAREGAVMTATPQNGTGWSGRQPGVRVRAGTPLRIDGGLEGAHVRAAIEQPWLRVVGFLPRGYVGRTFVPDAPEPAPAEPADARVREPTALLAAPGGMEMGRVDPRMRPDGVLVRRIGPEQSGFVLVRHEDAMATAVGWIAASTLEPGTVASGGGRISGGRAQVDVAAPSVELVRGTLLRGGALRNPIGVVTQTARFHCVAGCDDAQPRVEVDACTTLLGVWADAAR